MFFALKLKKEKSFLQHGNLSGYEVRLHLAVLDQKFDTLNLMAILFLCVVAVLCYGAWLGWVGFSRLASTTI